MAIGTEDEDLMYSKEISTRRRTRTRRQSITHQRRLHRVPLARAFPGQLSLFIIILLTNKAHVASK
jgi:hypothetical protein